MTPAHADRLRRGLAIMTAATCPFSALAGPNPVHIRPVAITGQPAPGAPAGALYARFLTVATPPTSIAPDSSIGFSASLSDQTTGLWLDHAAGAQLLARTGDAAPGAPGATFAFFPQLKIAEPPMLSNGNAVFSAALAGPGIGFTNDDGVWRSSASGLALVAREDSPAPGIPGARLSEMQVHSIDAAGRVVLSTLLTGAVAETNNETIWRAAPGAELQLLVREGIAAPDVDPGVVFANPDSPSTFPFVIGNAGGDLFFQGNLDGPGTDLHNNEALFIRSAAGLRLFIREGDPVPGLPGFAFRQGGTAGFHESNISFNNLSRVAMTASIQSATLTANAILTNADADLHLIARSGDPAPGTDGRFDIITTPFMNNHGDVAFLATIEPGGTLGLWVYSAGQLHSVALPDQPVPGHPQGDRYLGVQFIHGFSDDGKILFNAAIFSPLGAALVLADVSTGDAAILARILDDITLAPGDVRNVREIVAPRFALSDASHAAFVVRFADGSSAQLEASLDRPCTADINHDGAVTSQDFFDFLPAFFAGQPAADFNNDAVVNSQDFFDFLTAFFIGCQ